jgi:DNA-binding transcriptional ArsR family regulator
MGISNKNAKIFKILSVPTRLEIIELLKQRPFCVNALSHRLNVSPAAVSQHLKILKDAEIVIAKKRGYFVHYSINKTTLSELKKTAYKIFEYAPENDKNDPFTSANN